MDDTRKEKKFVDALEDEAYEQLKVISKNRESGGTDGKNVKMAIGVIGAFVRLRATIENGRSNDLIERRLGLLEGDAPVKQLEASH